MKILLVNNNTVHLDYLKAALTPHEIEVVMYQPGASFNYQDKDLVVLSGGGGEGNEINDTVDMGKLWYEDEMKLIMECPKPIVGICMGFEVIARAFGSSVRELDNLIHGFRRLTPTGKGKEIFGRDAIRQFEAHKWNVQSIDTEQFDVLADSPSGLEIIRHKSRPIIATQFHPEKGGTLSVEDMIAAVGAQ